MQSQSTYKGKKTRIRTREEKKKTFKDGMQLDLKMEEKSTGKGIQVASRSWKIKEIFSILPS